MKLPAKPPPSSSTSFSCRSLACGVEGTEEDGSRAAPHGTGGSVAGIVGSMRAGLS